MIKRTINSLNYITKAKIANEPQIYLVDGRRMMHTQLEVNEAPERIAALMGGDYCICDFFYTPLELWGEDDASSYINLVLMLQQHYIRLSSKLPMIAFALHANTTYPHVHYMLPREKHLVRAAAREDIPPKPPQRKHLEVSQDTIYSLFAHISCEMPRENFVFVSCQNSVFRVPRSFDPYCWSLKMKRDLSAIRDLFAARDEYAEAITAMKSRAPSLLAL